MNIWYYLYTVDAWAHDARIYIILALIALNFILAVAEALRTGTFEWARLADFYRKDVVPKLIGYLALDLIFRAVLGTESYIGDGAQVAAFGVLAASLVASVIAHLRGIYDAWPVIPQE